MSMSSRPGWSSFFNTTLGSHLFWGCLSLLFATAACFFYWQNRENELLARTLRDQQATLQSENDELRGEMNKLETGLNQAGRQLKERETSPATAEKAPAITIDRLDQEKQRQLRAQNDHEMREILRSFASGEDITLIDREGMPALRISNSFLYEPNEVTLRPAAREMLRKIAEVVSPRLNKTAIRLESFTDNEPMAALFARQYGSNYELSATRAASVARFFIEETHVPTERVSIIGRGASFPIASNATKEGRQQNRRLELLLEPAPPTVPPPAVP